MTAHSPSQALFDTPLVLSFRAGDEPALSFTSRCADDADRHQLLKFLTDSNVVPASAKAGQRAERLMKTIPLPTRLTADDALVAATALRLKLPLYSLDPDRYAGVRGLTALPAR